MFKFSGANAHWLALIDPFSRADISSAYHPTHYQIDDAMKTAKEMGINVIRSFTLGVSVGSIFSVEPELGVFNDSQFEDIDYTIVSARYYGIRLIIPFTDLWEAHHGGKKTFTEWRGVPEDDFFTDANVIQDFKNYISHIINHVNQYTGIALKNDPTILAWETGNEVNTISTTWGTAQDAWTQNIATYIKSIDNNHLVADGHMAENNSNTQFTAQQLSNSAIDMLTDHFYPMHISVLDTNAAACADANKVYYIGEYDWTDTNAYPAAGTLSQELDGAEYAAKINVTTATSVMPGNIQFRSAPFAFTANTTYTISFYAKASNNNIIYSVPRLALSPYTRLVSTYHKLSSEYQFFSYTYTPTIDYNSVRLSFFLAAYVGNIWFKNVSVTDGTTNLILNPDFSQTSDGVLTSWNLQILETSGDILSDFLPAIRNNQNVAGSLFWELYCHNYINGYDHRDALSMNYPGSTADVQNKIQLVRAHNFSMRGSSVPAHIKPLAPLINSITFNGLDLTIDWRGSAGAISYILQESENRYMWDNTQSGLSDFYSPATVTVSKIATYYRLMPVSLDGIYGDVSNIIHIL